MNKPMPIDSRPVDIAIVGGGLAGFSLASALLGLDFSVTLIDAKPAFESNSEQDSNYVEHFDDRALALSSASLAYLEAIDVLSSLDISGLTAIKHIHVSDRGHIGMVKLDAKEIGESYLGKVIPAPQLGRNLANRIKQAKTNIQFKHLVSTQVNHIQQQDSHALLSTLSDSGEEGQIQAKLVVLADGGQSSLSEQIGTSEKRYDYDQVGILANVSTSQAHNNIAYERFTLNGPIALLPLRDKDYKLVWTVSTEQAESVMQLSDQDFLTRLQLEFGDRAGVFEKVGKRVSYPMYEVRRSTIHSGRVVLIGNSAHTLHPIAGQGFNLGLRDISCLVSLLAKNSHYSISNLKAVLELLTDYSAKREQDVKRTSLFTDGLVRGFSNNNAAKAAFRNAGLVFLQNAPFLKKNFMRQLIGSSIKTNLNE